MDILALGVVWIALALIAVAVREIAEIALVVGAVVIVCMLIHIHMRGRKK